MEAHCSTGDPCETVKKASYFTCATVAMLFSKKNRIESSHCAFTFYFLNIAPLHQKDNTIHANSCFSALLLIAFSSNYTICSKPLCNLFRIFFLAAVVFIHLDRAFYDPLRAQSATVPQNSPFLLHFSVFAQFFVSHAPVCGGAWRLGGRLVGGMAGLRRTVPVFFAARWVHRAPANGLRCLRRRVRVWWIARPPTGRRSPFTTGCGFAADMPFAFLSPLPCT